jgi:Transposase DDE domain group 1
MSQQDAFELTFDFLPDRKVFVQQDDMPLTSDAGLLPIRQFDQRLGFTRRFAECLNDSRSDPVHSIVSMVRQRLFGILAGYEDCNDHDRLRDDPVFKLLARDRYLDDALAAQPSLCRFENSIDCASLQKLLDFNIDTGIQALRAAHQGKLPDSITLDLDATDDPTHGDQQLSLFHGYYDQHQYFPLIISEPTTKHIFLAWLRPGAVHASLGADDDLMRVVNQLRIAQPDMNIHVRADCGFGLPKMYQCCESLGVSYTFGIGGNDRLKEIAQPLLDHAIEQYKLTKQKQRLFMFIPNYRAHSWDRDRMIVVKAEAHEKGPNLRFVVTSLPCQSDSEAQNIYDDYVQRGESEHRMDELKNGLKMDRLSCTRFKANFFRLLLHVAAMNLLNRLRHHDQVPQELRVAQPQTWRDKLIKVAARVIVSTRRVVVSLSGNWPFDRFYEAVGRRSLLLRAE